MLPSLPCLVDLAAWDRLQTPWDPVLDKVLDGWMDDGWVDEWTIQYGKSIV